jgi:hypothetical protein
MGSLFLPVRATTGSRRPYYGVAPLLATGRRVIPRWGNSATGISLLSTARNLTCEPMLDIRRMRCRPRVIVPVSESANCAPVSRIHLYRWRGGAILGGGRSGAWGGPFSVRPNLLISLDAAKSRYVVDFERRKIAQIKAPHGGALPVRYGRSQTTAAPRLAPQPHPPAP